MDLKPQQCFGRCKDFDVPIQNPNWHVHMNRLRIDVYHYANWQAQHLT